jgi:hypothetical protein
VKTDLKCIVFVSAMEAMTAANGEPAPQPVDLMRPGRGDWCYAPVGKLTETQKQDFVLGVVESAKRAQAKYGVPGAILAGMAIHESGYGRTRLAILSNNLLSFKLPTNPNWQFGRPSFVLWCQPEGDVGNKYLFFGSKEAAFDYVAKVLTERADMPYAAITKSFRDSLAAGIDPGAAAIEWLKSIASQYAEDGNYVANVLQYVDNPITPGMPASRDQSLWALVQ